MPGIEIFLVVYVSILWALILYAHRRKSLFAS